MEKKAREKFRAESPSQLRRGSLAEKSVDSGADTPGGDSPRNLPPPSLGPIDEVENTAVLAGREG